MNEWQFLVTPQGDIKYISCIASLLPFFLSFMLSVHFSFFLHSKITNLYLSHYLISLVRVLFHFLCILNRRFCFPLDLFFLLIFFSLFDIAATIAYPTDLNARDCQGCHVMPEISGTGEPLGTWFPSVAPEWSMAPAWSVDEKDTCMYPGWLACCCALMHAIINATGLNFDPGCK